MPVPELPLLFTTVSIGDNTLIPSNDKKMTRWRNKAITNLLANSTEERDHAIAASEWKFTGKVIDHFDSDETCHLCEAENLRYHFEIINKQRGGTTLLVGSSCIRKFDIAVFDDNGTEIFGKQKASYLQRKIDEKKRELMLDQLRVLWEKSSPGDKKIVQLYVHYFKRDNTFFLDDLCSLFSLMLKYGVEFTPALFKVSLRKQSDLLSLVNLSEDCKKNIMPCLSVAQKKRFASRRKQDEERKGGKDAPEENEYISVSEFDSSLSKIVIETTPSSFDNQSVVLARNFKDVSNPFKPEGEKIEPFQLPEYVTCSICGEYTRDWISFNPNQCRKCLKTS